MATFKDIFKRSFIEGFSRYDMTPANIIMVFAISSLFSLYIFFAYRILTRKTFYSKSFNITLAAVNLITAAIILTMQSNVVISLGMVGALSIVRFRTAVKDPMDLTFLFWSIASGIICGAGQAEIAFALAAVLTLALLFFEKIPVSKAPKILMASGNINCQTIGDEKSSTLAGKSAGSGKAALEEVIMEAVKKHCRYCTIKSRSIADGRLDIVIEVRTDEDEALIAEVSAAKEVDHASLLAHDGEVTY